MNSGMNLRRLFLVAVLLPAAIVLIDHWSLSGYEIGHPSLLRTLTIYALFVGQVGLLGWIVGRCVPHQVLCWAVYVWGIALVDISCCAAAFADSSGWDSKGLSWLVYALVSAQVGMIAAWTILATTPPWQWRLPGLAVMASALGYFCLSLTLQDGKDVWMATMLAQSVVILSLCSFLRILGFRMERCLPSEQEPDCSGSISCLQFSIRDMLVWTTATVPVLVVAKEVDWFLLLDFGWHAMILAMMLGIGCAAATLVGMWAGLGKGSIVVRLAILGTAAPAIGALLAWAMTPANRTGISSAWAGIFFWIAERIGYTWIAWTSLAAGFLAASLLIFRARGYRLLRKRRSGTPLTNG
jgi:hypothetical protein